MHLFEFSDRDRPFETEHPLRPGNDIPEKPSGLDVDNRLRGRLSAHGQPVRQELDLINVQRQVRGRHGSNNLDGRFRYVMNVPGEILAATQFQLNGSDPFPDGNRQGRFILAHIDA